MFQRLRTMMSSVEAWAEFARPSMYNRSKYFAEQFVAVEEKDISITGNERSEMLNVEQSCDSDA